MCQFLESLVVIEYMSFTKKIYIGLYLVGLTDTFIILHYGFGSWTSIKGVLLLEYDAIAQNDQSLELY